MSVLIVVIDLSFACVFLLAAYHKWLEPDTIAGYIRRLGFPRYGTGIAYLLIGGECLLAAASISNVMPFLVDAAIIAVLVAFTATLAWQRKQGIRGCACFGEHSRLSRHPLLRNAILLLLGIADYYYSPYPYEWAETGVILASLMAALSLYAIMHYWKKVNKIYEIGDKL